MCVCTVQFYSISFVLVLCVHHPKPSLLWSTFIPLYLLPLSAPFSSGNHHTVSYVYEFLGFGLLVGWLVGVFLLNAFTFITQLPNSFPLIAVIPSCFGVIWVNPFMFKIQIALTMWTFIIQTFNIKTQKVYRLLKMSINIVTLVTFHISRSQILVSDHCPLKGTTPRL